MKKLKLGVLGAANIFLGKVLPPLLKSSKIEVYALASRDGVRAEEAAKRFGIPKAYSSYEALLADPNVDFVYIPLPNHLHLEWIKKCADAGKHVLCEKPLTMNAPEAQEALDYAKKKNVLLMEAFMYRFHPQWIKAREIVHFGELGKIKTIHTVFSYSNSDPKNIRNRKDTGGGALLDIGCYAVSTARFLLGQEPKRVFSVIDYDPAFQTDILSQAILDFGDVRTLFSVGTQTFPAQRVEVFGTKGELTVELPFNMHPDVPARLTIKGGLDERVLNLGPADQYLEQCEAFADAVLEKKPAPTPPEDAVNNMKVLDALFRGGQSGVWERV